MDCERVDMVKLVAEERFLVADCARSTLPAAGGKGENAGSRASSARGEKKFVNGMGSSLPTPERS